PKEPAVVGYFLAQLKFGVEGELKQHVGWLKTTLKKDEVKLAIEKKLTEDTKATFAVKLDEKSLKPIAEAVAKGSKDDLVQALFKAFEATIKTTYKWDKLSIVPEAGLEVSKTPLTVRISGEFEDSFLLEKSPFNGKFAVKAGLSVGLSAKGWAWIGNQ